MTARQHDALRQIISTANKNPGLASDLQLEIQPMSGWRKLSMATAAAFIMYSGGNASICMTLAGEHQH